MNRITLIFMLLLTVKAWGGENYCDRVKDESIAVLSNQIGKEHVSELVTVSVETRKFLVSLGKYASVNKVIFVDPKSEAQRKPNQNSPLNIEARMAELQARADERASPTIFQYKSYVVLTGGREKVSEETYDSYFQTNQKSTLTIIYGPLPQAVSKRIFDACIG
jgi:hypothetical protein